MGGCAVPPDPVALAAVMCPQDVAGSGRRAGPSVPCGTPALSASATLTDPVTQLSLASMHVKM